MPTATDIAFAVGVLALLGRSIPANVRVFLLALAIIDDIIAVLIIALFYSGRLDYNGFAVAGLAILIVLGLQQIGIGLAYAYVAPGVIVWIGFLMTGAHPTLAGVVLGMMTPVLPLRMRERPLDVMTRTAEMLVNEDGSGTPEANHLALPLKQFRLAQRELLPPVVRVQMALHPWVAYGIMPLFALANAGVSLGGVDLSAADPGWIMGGRCAGAGGRQAFRRNRSERAHGAAGLVPLAAGRVLRRNLLDWPAGRHRLHDVHFHRNARVCR